MVRYGRRIIRLPFWIQQRRSLAAGARYRVERFFIRWVRHAESGTHASNETPGEGEDTKEKVCGRGHIVPELQGSQSTSVLAAGLSGEAAFAGRLYNQGAQSRHI